VKAWLGQQFRSEEEKKRREKKGAEKIYHHRTPRIAKANCMWRKKIGEKFGDQSETNLGGGTD
jgi:hypothetical protein